LSIFDGIEPESEWCHRLPNAMLKLKNSRGFEWNPKYPINPAIISGSKFGINETTTILKERNMKIIRREISKLQKQ
jgi:hypothetical protein